VLVVGSASKTYSMTGWRVGWLLGPEPVVRRRRKAPEPEHLERHLHRAEGRRRGLRGPQDSVAAMLAEYRRRRDFVVERVRAIPESPAPSRKGVSTYFRM